MSEDKIYLSVIIPAYNEADRIEKTLRAVAEYLSKQAYAYEIFVVDDGSSDGTEEVVRRLEGVIPRLRLIDNSENHGKGWVVKQGMQEVKGKIRLFMDADNATSVDHVERMIPYFEQGYDVVIGSRRVPGAVIAVHQSFFRENIGRIFNLIVRLIAWLPMNDTQAGFKAFSAEAVLKIFPKQTIWRWAFDVELLVIAKKLGLKIKEVPITWINDPKTHVKLKGMVKMLLEVLQVRWNMIRGIYQ